MKTCEEMLFGISIDKHILFKASLVLLCFLSLLLILISILAVWLRKIQRQIVCLTKNTCSLPLVISNKKAATFKKRHSWKTLVVANTYGPLGFDGDTPRSDLHRETSFDNSLAQENDGTSPHDSNTQEEVDDSSATHHFTNHHSQMNTKGDYKLEKDYMSLKNLKGAKEHTYAKPCANSPRLKNKMGRLDMRQNGRSEKQMKEAHQDDNEYLVVIHSDKSPTLSEGTETETPPHEDESLYLIPVESKPEENGHHKLERKTGTEFEGKSKDGVSKNDDRVSPLDDPARGKYGYIPGQHNAEFQQTPPGFIKDADEDDSGYLILQHVEGGATGKVGTNIPVGPFQAGGTSENEGSVNPRHGDDNSYEYIQTKDWTGPVDNSDSKVQKNNPTGKGKPVPNSSAEDNHDYPTAVYETGVNSSKEQEHSTSRIFSIIHDTNNNNNAGVQSEVGGQNPGVEYSDDIPVYENNDAQQQSSMCNNPAFCNVDESPLYDNPVRLHRLLQEGSNCK